MTKKVAVILSGCGFLDGAEIHESVLTLLHLHKNQAEPFCFAPDLLQTQVNNHVTKKTVAEERNILVESARIARCEISSLEKLQAKDYDAVIFPGGFGAALNLCDFAKAGADCSVNPLVEKVILDFHNQKKPMGFLCIAPALAARVLGEHGVQLTIGTDADTMAALKKMGAKPKACQVDEICVDETLKVVSTPAYMLGQNPFEVEAGIASVIAKILEWIG